MNIIRFFQRRISFDVEPIEVEDPKVLTWLTIPGVLDSEIQSLSENLSVWAYTSDLDFVESEEGDLYYLNQVPGLYGSIDVGDLKVPFFLYPIRGNEESYLVHVYTEQDMSAIESYFTDGFFIVSRKGMQVCFLEPVPASLKSIISKFYSQGDS